MCPGGYVVNASSEKDGCVVNGMSYHRRDSANANSAVVVTVTPEDFPSGDVLAGVEFQRQWERKAFEAGNGKVPVQLFKDFQEGRTSHAFGEIHPVHRGATAFADLNDCLPAYVCESLKEGIKAFGHKIKILTGKMPYYPAWKPGHHPRCVWKEIRNTSPASAAFIHAVKVPVMPEVLPPRQWTDCVLPKPLRKHITRIQKQKKKN